VRPGALPAANVVARLYPVTIAVVLATVGFVLLLTPTGSPPSPRWRWWARGLAVAVAVALVAATSAPGSLDPLAQFVSGPLDPQVYGGALRVANQLALFAGLLTILAGAASLVVRFRSARGVERLQLQWVALAAALTGLSMLVAAIRSPSARSAWPAGRAWSGCSSSRWPPGRRSCVTGCTTLTGSSAGPWPTGC
jgi:hypothetical protein